MSVKKYFQKLESKLHKNQYMERFLQELQDHLEDSIHEKVLKGASGKTAEENSLRNLGDPEEVAKNFNVTTHDGSLLALYLEGLLFGILSIPLYLNSITLSTVFPLGTTATEIFSTLLGLLLLLFIIIGFSYILYSLAFSRFFIAASNQPPFYWLLYLVVLLLPPFIVYSVILVSNWDRSLITINGPMTLAYFLPTLATALYTYHQNHRGILFLAELSIAKTSKERRWLPIIPIYFLGAHALRFFIPAIFSGDSVYTIIMAPLLIIEFFIRIIGNLFFFITPNHLGVMGGHWVMALLLALVAILSFMQTINAIIKKQKVRKIWIHVSVLSFILPLLLLPPRSSLAIQWKTPHTDISYRIETDQNWPFHTFIKKYQSGIGDRFIHYEALPSEDTFLIEEDIVGSFILSDIKDIQNYKLIRKGSGKTIFQKIPSTRKTAQLPAGFECKNLPSTSQNKTIATDGSIFCPRLMYRGQLLYEAKSSPLYLIGIALSKERKWALINLSESGGFSPEELYLIPL